MDRAEIAAMFGSKIILKKFHWLSYHFSSYMDGYEHFLAASIINCCENIEKIIPGFSKDFSDKLASFSDKEKYLPHYEQLIQALAELLVINHLCTKFPQQARFEIEPTSGMSAKNPEIGISYEGKKLYVEVKCREFITHHNNRGSAAIEIPTRMSGIREVANELVREGESIVYPRDNVVKDFLISANDKFSSFKEEDKECITVLVVVWDDFTYEPISSLLNLETGLLTERSFYKGGSGDPVRFENIDAIVLVRQSHQIVRATRDELPTDGLKHPLDWGDKIDVLPKAVIPVNLLGGEAIGYLCDLFDAYHIDDLSHLADFRPQEMVLHV